MPEKRGGRGDDGHNNITVVKITEDNTVPTYVVVHIFLFETCPCLNCRDPLTGIFFKRTDVRPSYFVIFYYIYNYYL